MYLFLPQDLCHRLCRQDLKVGGTWWQPVSRQTCARSRTGEVRMAAPSTWAHNLFVIATWFSTSPMNLTCRSGIERIGFLLENHKMFWICFWFKVWVLITFSRMWLTEKPYQKNLVSKLVRLLWDCVGQKIFLPSCWKPIKCSFKNIPITLNKISVWQKMYRSICIV